VTQIEFDAAIIDWAGRAIVMKIAIRRSQERESFRRWRVANLEKERARKRADYATKPEYRARIIAQSSRWALENAERKRQLDKEAGQRRRTRITEQKWTDLMSKRSKKK